MMTITSELEILRGAALILESDEFDLIRLAKFAGYEVQDFYIGANFKGVDIRGCDLRTLNLIGANLEGAIFDESTAIDPRFVPPNWNLNQYKSAELTSLVYEYLSKEVHEGEFKTLTSCLRYLVHQCHIHAPTFDDIIKWRNLISNKKSYISALNSPRRHRKNMSLKVYSEEHRYVLTVGRAFHGRSAGYNAAAMIGMEIQAGNFPKGLGMPPSELALFPQISESKLR